MPPNLLFVLPDQMRGQAMGFLGEEPVRTPNLDRFATEALVLDSAVANYPICSPYRGMLMTGKYPHANKVTANCNSDTAPYDVELQEQDRCWSDILKANDYSLGYIGKWHLDAPRHPYIDCYNNQQQTKWNEWCPPNRRHGFDFWYSYGTYDYHTRPMYWRTDATREEFHFVDQWGPEHEADLASKYIRNEGGAYRKPNRPFALVVSMNPPHMPYELVPERYVAQYADLTLDELCPRPNILPAGTQWGDYYRANIRNYFGMITGIDDQFGRIVEVLDDTNLTNETIVIFTSDHGNCLGIHNEISKGNHYEESLRVPFMIRWPGEIVRKRDDLLLSTPDIYPTLMDLMGFGKDIPVDTQGTSYAEIFRGNQDRRPRSQLCMYTSADQPTFGWRAVRTHTHTLMINRESDQPTDVRLHSNIEDPYQLQDVAADNAQMVQALSVELSGWLQRTNDAFEF